MANVPVIAIVGRTNVGKSSLFNSIVGKRVSIVEDEPGVTRDRNYAFVERFDFPFTLVDTGGLVGEEDNLLKEAVRAQTDSAIREADLIVAMFDGLHGLHPLDREVVQIIRRSEKPVVWVVNKCESPNTELNAAELYGLGIEEFVPVSAAHNRGIKELIGKVRAALELPTKKSDLSETKISDPGPIKVAIVGKPNVGKSTFINRLVGEERLVTSEIAGTTRDSIMIPLKRDGQDYFVYDTAGLRKKGKVDEGVERFSNLRALSVLADADVAILIIDATEGVNDQDEKIGGLIHERGRGFIIAVNKWDAVEKDHKSVKEYEAMIRSSLKYAAYAPIIFISALSGRRCPNVLEKAREIVEKGKLRAKTSELNKVLSKAVEKRPPASYRGEPIKLFFATQTSDAPPEFVLFFNFPARVNFSYERYLKNTIRDEFGFDGYDIKIRLRKRTEKANRLKEAANA